MPLPDTEDTIAAIATARGAAAIGIIRLSGPDSLGIAGRLFRPHSGTPVAELAPGTFTVGLFSHDGEPVDEGLLLVFGEGRSYTGQEAVEMQVHGGTAVLRRLLAAAVAEGARPAGPGEFTLRAYLGGKLDLAQAESVLALIEAEGDAARRNALAGLGGGLSRSIDSLQTELTAVHAGLQAALDYPDEVVAGHDFTTPVTRALGSIRRLLASARAGRLAGSGARLALLGRPNSGKSSLLNALAGYERSLVSSTPGTTRDYLEERLELGGIPVTVVDTAGIRSDAGDIEARGVALSHRLADSADLVLVLLDPLADRDGDSRTDALLASVPASRRIVLWSKADIAAPPAAPAADLAVSSVSGEGLPELEELLLGRLLGGSSSAAEGWIGSERHERALREAETALVSALGAPEDLAALDVLEAVRALSRITGRSDVTSETLELIFANFCVGK